MQNDGWQRAATDDAGRTGKENKWKPACWNFGSTGCNGPEKPESAAAESSVLGFIRDVFLKL